MKTFVGATLVVAMVLPCGAAFAADKTGVVKNWFEGKREIVLADNTECKLGADIKDLPKEPIGKTATLTFTTANGINTCSAVVLK